MMYYFMSQYVALSLGAGYHRESFNTQSYSQILSLFLLHPALVLYPHLFQNKLNVYRFWTLAMRLQGAIGFGNYISESGSFSNEENLLRLAVALQPGLMFNLWGGMYLATYFNLLSLTNDRYSFNNTSSSSSQLDFALNKRYLALEFLWRLGGGGDSR